MTCPTPTETPLQQIVREHSLSLSDEAVFKRFVQAAGASTEHADYSTLAHLYEIWDETR
ncbi:MAG TPA: hypothetical protein VJS44_08265 [Pyrinomonadaceae bacterium]|nr:hypothetical protein [Pyrinomonadaceae bacterium]